MSETMKNATKRHAYEKERLGEERAHRKQAARWWGTVAPSSCCEALSPLYALRRDSVAVRHRSILFYANQERSPVVPTRERARLRVWCTANPKSASLTVSPAMTTFSGLRSRCIRRLLWR